MKTLRDKDTRAVVTTTFVEKACMEHFGVGGKRCYLHEDVKEAVLDLLKYNKYFTEAIEKKEEFEIECYFMEKYAISIREKKSSFVIKTIFGSFN